MKIAENRPLQRIICVRCNIFPAGGVFVYIPTMFRSNGPSNQTPERLQEGERPRYRKGPDGWLTRVKEKPDPKPAPDSSQN